ncbi:type III secretion protein D [Pantoea sp. PNA 14-12]|uniref:type III secretion system inner membrane ring subunit SctD n=1 Tax=Pantoea TaxID=53335 RepID=UPI00050DA440|nr:MULTISPECIES: type III secretion system inner membrane ring subunit SctD [Pantoea]KGD80071.1 type III secretion protein [Pantoea stewartii subsp. indologenes]KHE01080.1 type III secretion protein [Pantoea stewartii]KHN63375.1 type III secretion protein [Pantoea stewartii]NRH24883.1 EscD/YscD/HrpQ family type III secretion system inner membrane ring protein [Pantoea stewartii]PXV73961.1 type III secretion protein D [Pantoea sp. PNA 03-3]
MHELRVLTGLHRGAALPLSGDKWWIGADEHADLALYDPGIKDRHCQLVKTPQGWEVKASDGPVKDNEGQRCEALSNLQPGTAFAVGHIWLSIVDAATPWPEDEAELLHDAESAHDSEPTLVEASASVQPVSEHLSAKKSPLPFWAKLSYMGLTLLLVMMLGTWMLNTSIASPSAPPAPGKPSLTSVPRTRQIIASMLLDRGLNKHVSLTSDNQSVTLSGGVTDEENQRLQRMLKTLYRHYDVRLPIHNHVGAASVKLPFNIVQITSGAHANIVTDSGQRIFIGDEVDQLRLVAINSDSIEFAGRENIRVKW